MNVLHIPSGRPARAFRTWRKAVLLPLLLLAGAAAPAQDDWPVVVLSGQDRIQVFEPQPEAIDGNRLVLRSAVSLQRAGESDPAFGTIWADAVMEMDRTSRLGRMTSFTVTDTRFPALDEAGRAAFARTLSEQLPAQAPVLSLDHLVAALEREKEGSAEYVNNPPEIIYQERPGVLVFVDGEPRYEAMEREPSRYDDPNHLPPGGRAERVVNTPFIMLRLDGDRHYLYGSDMWFSADAIAGPWARDYNVPQLARDLVKQVDEGAALSTTASDGSKVVPTIVVRTVPAVLIDLDGPPQWRSVAGTGLLYAANSTKDVFMDPGSQQYFVLASGRWFSTTDMASGTWRHVAPDKLPTDFAKIPEGSVKDGVLAHVAGTDAAREAVRDSYVPQTARVERHNTDFSVRYEGEPWFDPIPGTVVELAVNASVTVLRINGHYHALDNAVWYDAPGPHGPWQVSTSVPAEVNTIPPSSPAYNTRYVYIYDHTPQVVYVGYTPGYLGSFVQYGVPIYGTGYYYPYWRGYWRPRPYTWGFNMYYDPWVGWGYNWGWGWSWYYPTWYGWGWGAHRPWGWGWGWCGPYGYHPPVVYANNSFYGPRGSLNSPRNAGTMRQGGTARSEARDLYAGRTDAGITSSRVPRGSAAGTRVETGRTTGAPQDIFSDREGNVYRRSGERTERLENGRWRQQPENGGRTAPRQDTGTRQETPRQVPPVRTPREPVQTPPVTRPAPREIQHDRDRGRQREQGFQQYQQRPATPPAPPRAAPSPAPAPPRTAPAPAPAPRSTPAPAPQRAPKTAPSGGGSRGGGAPSRGGGGRR
ncbi:MAG: hypothetical protein RBT71_12635 [Flavobacteriales bacterium]|jgi:hypothetical protein|nr:hypothetical protein [Flavobacteriales bacterium]